MRLLVVAIVGLMLVSGCGSPGTSASTGSPATSSPTAASGDATSKPAAGGDAGAATIVKLSIDGKAIALEGDSKVTIQSGGTFGVIYVDAGKNARGSSRSGYGTRLELGNNAGELKEGFAAHDIRVATFTVWKDDQFSYMSTGALPGQPVQGLTLERTSGRLKGSYETDVSGLAGKFRARIDFDAPFPK